MAESLDVRKPTQLLIDGRWVDCVAVMSYDNRVVASYENGATRSQYWMSAHEGKIRNKLGADPQVIDFRTAKARLELEAEIRKFEEFCKEAFV